MSSSLRDVSEMTRDFLKINIEMACSAFFACILKQELNCYMYQCFCTVLLANMWNANEFDVHVYYNVTDDCFKDVTELSITHTKLHPTEILYKSYKRTMGYSFVWVVAIN